LTQVKNCTETCRIKRPAIFFGTQFWWLAKSVL